MTKIREAEPDSATSGQTIGITYNTGYTELRTSGKDDVYGNSDDIITKYIFDENNRVITKYSTNLSGTQIYGVSSGEYESDNESAPNSLKVSSTTGGSSANYLLNGGFENTSTGWRTSGTVNYSYDQYLGKSKAILNANANSTSSIYQFVYLRPGTYTLAVDFDCDLNSTSEIWLKAESTSNSSHTTLV